MTEEYGAEYYEGNGQAGDRPALRYYERVARRHLGRGALLDFGCGTGHLLKRLTSRGPADGLESHEHGARAAAALVPASRVHRDVADVDDAAYDGIVSVHVVEHVPDDPLRQLLGEWHRVLRPHGRALVVTPDLGGRAHQLKGAAWGAFTDSTHVNLKGHADWVRFFEEAGFDVLRTAADGLWDFPYTPGVPPLVDAARRGWPTAYQYVRGDLLLPVGSGEAVLLLVEAR